MVANCLFVAVVAVAMQIRIHCQCSEWGLRAVVRLKESNICFSNDYLASSC